MASLTDSMAALTTAAPPFVCGITREMPEKPVELIDCGHLFDQDALRRWRAAGKTRCPECGGPLDSRPSSVVAASLRAYRARSRRDAAVERDDVVVAKGRPLGRGSHGVVKKASWRGRPVAVKQVPLDDDEAAVAMQRELKALRALRHPNVVALLGALTDDDEGLLWAILEFAPHGSLHRMLHRSSESDMRACFGDAKALPGLGEAFWGVAADVCAALAFLHRRSVIHGDVKAANVLLGNGGVAKISDFGLARVVGTAGFTRTSSSHGGTAGYMAPELGEAGALDRDGASADIFAVAVLLAEVLTGEEPFADARNDVAIALRVRDGERPALPKSTPRQLREALMRCWDSNSAARPDAKDLLLDVLDLRLDNDASTVRDDGVEVVRVTTRTGCKQLSSVLAEQGLRDVIPIVRENEVDIEAARLMDNDDWQEIGLDERAARNVVASLGTDLIRLKVRTPDGEVVELTTQTSTTVRELLRRLEDEYDCGVERARLFRCGGDKSGAALREENSLFDERVRKDCELDLKRGRSPPYGVPFPLYIRDLTGGAQSTLQLTVESCFTLKALMQLALETRSPPVSVEDDWRYRLEWCGKHLFASETVLDRCDIPKEATIMLVPRVHALVR